MNNPIFLLLGVYLIVATACSPNQPPASKDSEPQWIADDEETMRLLMTSMQVVFPEVAFSKAYNGRFKNISPQSVSIVSRIIDGRLEAEKIDGKYFMYWCRGGIYAATSDDLINWEPILDKNNELKEIVNPKRNDPDECRICCGLPAVANGNKIVLPYRGWNKWGKAIAGQLLFDRQHPCKVLAQSENPI